MAKMYGTCGHGLNDGYEALALVAVNYDPITDDPVHSVNHVVYCHACARAARRLKQVLEDAAAEHDWLTRPLC